MDMSAYYTNAGVTPPTFDTTSAGSPFNPNFGSNLSSSIQSKVQAGLQPLQALKSSDYSTTPQPIVPSFNPSQSLYTPAESVIPQFQKPLTPTDTARMARTPRTPRPARSNARDSYGL